MAAPKGNKFWEARYTTGRKPKLATVTIFRKACIEYFEWVEENPLWENKVGFFQGEGYDHLVPKMRAPTLQGLWIFLGISKSTWYTWKAERKGFSEVMEYVEAVMFDMKFAGAAADLFNANIIARDLKLTDHTDITSDGEKLEGLRVEHV